jgi:murein DD-endopeptidase MepM/ murein hydrolase activator NlpD
MTLTFPNGPVQTKAPWGAFGIEWDVIEQYASFIEKAAQEFGVEPSRIAAHIVIESQGEARAAQHNPSNGDSYGLMQIVSYGVGWAGWHVLVAQIAALPESAQPKEIRQALYDPLTNIRVGTSILRDFFNQHGSWDRASSAFFLGNPDWRGADTVNGNTGQKYKQALMGLMSELAAPADGEPVAQDLIALVMGTPNYNLTFDWAAYGGPDFYEYGAGHSHELDGSNHTGLDIVAAFDAPLNAVFDGLVVCGATGWGGGAWSTGCAAFGDPMGGGAGRIEVLHTDGQRSLIYGHCHRSLVEPGQTVKAGQQIATIGGMNGAWHVHLEARQKRGTSGDYTIHDPRILFADLTGYVPKVERLDIPQPTEFERTWTVSVTSPNTPVLQRADPNASPVAEPLAVGEQFEAAYLTISDSTGEPYWISKARGRVPARNTNLAEVLGIETQEARPIDLTAIRDHAVKLHNAIDETGVTAFGLIKKLDDLEKELSA